MGLCGNCLAFLASFKQPLEELQLLATFTATFLACCRLLKSGENVKNIPGKDGATFEFVSLSHYCDIFHCN